MPIPKFIPHPDDFDVELNFYTKVVKLESLHWGYWKGIKDVSLKTLRLAQDAYTRKLLSLVPRGVKTVLDVGAGIGDNAVKFAARGYKVTAVTPEPTQVAVFKKLAKKNKRISVIGSRYEDLDVDREFDLVLMSESSNYFPLKVGMAQTARYVKKGGHLLVAGLFNKKHTGYIETLNVIEDFEKEATRNGLKLVKYEDITRDAIPSMELGAEFYKEYAAPALKLLTEYYGKAFKGKTFLFSLFFRKELYMMNRIFYKELPDRLDTKKFQKLSRYLIYLYKKV